MVNDPNLPPVVVPDPPANTLIPSLIRTYVPILVGLAVTYLAVHFNIALPVHLSDGAVTLLTSILIAVYYTLVRVLETRFPAIGVLLGLAKQPVYTGEHQAR